MITKNANNDTFGALNLIFLQGMKIFISLKVSKPKVSFPKIWNSVVTYVTKTDSFLTSNKLFIIAFSSPNKKDISS